MYASIALFFLILPVLLMIWMLIAQRRLRHQSRPEPELTVHAPWEEQVKGQGGLIYGKRLDPNEELTEAAARDEEMKRINSLGIGL